MTPQEYCAFLQTSWHLLPTGLSTLYSGVLDFMSINLNYLPFLMHRRQLDCRTPEGELSFPHFPLSPTTVQ